MIASAWMVVVQALPAPMDLSTKNEDRSLLKARRTVLSVTPKSLANFAFVSLDVQEAQVQPLTTNLNNRDLAVG